MLIRGHRKILLGLIISLFVAGIIIKFIAYFGEQAENEPVLSGAEVRFGDVLVNTSSREINFAGEIQQNTGWVRFLVYLSSYKWLEEESAIVSGANLVDLQMAVALLDWQLWDNLWHRKITGQEIEIFIQWEEDKINANELIDLPYLLGIGDLILLGSPLFDPLFIARCDETVLCVAIAQEYQCPLYFLQESVERKFMRPSGTAGYQLSAEKLPPPGTIVTVIIKIPNVDEGK